MDKITQLQIAQYEKVVNTLECEYLRAQSAGENRLRKAKAELDAELTRLNVRIQTMKNRIRDLKKKDQ